MGGVGGAGAAIGVTYSAFYDYMNCLVISPCASWLNSNETYRDGASERAVELNQQYVDIINEYTYACGWGAPDRLARVCVTRGGEVGGAAWRGAAPQVHPVRHGLL